MRQGKYGGAREAHARAGARLVKRAAVSAVLFLSLAAACVGITAAAAASSSPTWTVQSTPSPGSSSQELLSVACPAPGSCVAVGFTGQSVTNAQTLIETLSDGTWTKVSSPDVANSSTNYLYSVSCGAVGTCVAVGTSSSDGELDDEQTLVETLSGGTWSITPSFDPAGGFNVLNGVSCMSATDCVAVGSTGYGDPETLIESQAGSSWSATASGNGAPGALSSVSCVSATSCTAVGSVYATLSGGSWSVGSYVAPGSDSDLVGISCTTGGCVAVGEYYSDPNAEQWSTLVESYAAGTWTVVPSPNVGTDSYLYDVSCTDLEDCVAVGYSLNTPVYPQVSSSLALDLSDGAWSVDPTPNPEGTSGNALNRLLSVSCSAPSACQSVGWAEPNDGATSQTLAMASAAGSTATPHGYWLVGSDGGIFTFGGAQFYGSTGNLKLNRPVVGITVTSDRGGYWLDAADGGVFAFGDSTFYGSIPGIGIAPAGSGASRELNAPIVGMVPSYDDGGYFMVGADGGVFAFGDAKFEGSCPGLAGGCSGAAVAVMPDASGRGYWLVTATGRVYTFGDAVYLGAPGGQASPVTSAVRTADGAGYWILLADGDVFSYGDAGKFGSPSSFGGVNPATAVFATSDDSGYWVASANGSVDTFGDAPFDGSMAGTRLNGAIIAATGF
jgi:hypothetical protein